DAVARADLFRADARHLAGLHRMEDDRPLRGELEGVAVAAGDEDTAAAALLGGDGGGEKIVRLVARRLRVREAARGDEGGERLELLDELGIEMPSALVVREKALPIGRSVERVPPDEHRARLLARIEPQEKVCEADDGARAPAA